MLEIFKKKKSLLNSDLDPKPTKNDPKFYHQIQMRLFSTGIVDAEMLDSFHGAHGEGSASMIGCLNGRLHPLRARLVRGKSIYIYDPHKKAQIELRYTTELSAWIEKNFPCCAKLFEETKFMSD